MTPDWFFQVMWFSAGVGGSGALWYFLSQRNYHAAIWTGFGTVGVILLSVALHIRNSLLQRKQKTAISNRSLAPEQIASSNPTVTRQPEKPKVYLKEQSPNELAARIDSLKPLERELVANQTYNGRWVRWSGTILSIRSSTSFLEGGGFTIMVVDHFSVPANLEFLSTERHLVESLEEGDLISYEAKITRAFKSEVYLCEVTLTQPEERTFVDSKPEDLTRAFEEHTEIQARTRVADAIGKWMKVSGHLGNVGDFTSFAQVTFVHPPSPHPTVYMYFRKKRWFDRLSVLNRGDNITVVGRISEVRYGELHLENCELIDLGR